MGIPGLWTFVKRNDKRLLAPYTLSNGSRVVIDGNNLSGSLYRVCNIPSKYGGDHAQFERKVTCFFKNLMSFGIAPYVVFDGALDKGQRKRDTKMKRQVRTLSKAESLSNGEHPGDALVPLLATETFRHVLNYLGVSNVTCDYEADGEIAALANKWHCPVMANDTDFFIYDIEMGCIWLSDSQLVELAAKVSQNVQFECYLYTLSKFVKQYKLRNKRIAPLFATLMGNDCVKEDKFMTFWENRFPRTTHRQDKMGYLLAWLEGQTYDEARHAVLNCYKHMPVPLLESIRAINRSVESYTNLSTNLDTYFAGRKDDRFLMTQLWSDNRYFPPPWFVCQVRTGELTRSLMNVFVHRKVFLTPQIEMSTAPSAHYVARSIRQAMCTVILTGDSDSGSPVEEYDRVERGMKWVPITLLSSNKVPKLIDVAQMSKDARSTTIFDILKIKQTDVFCAAPGDIQLVLMTLVYLKENADPQVGKCHLMALLISLVYFWPLEELVGTDSRAWEKLQYFTRAEDPDVPLDTTTVHAFSQFQACFFAVMQLNQILRCPFPCPSPARFCNGTFFYNLSKKSNSFNKLKMEEVLDELVGHSPGVFNYCDHRLFTLETMLDGVMFGVYSDNSFAQTEDFSYEELHQFGNRVICELCGKPGHSEENCRWKATKKNISHKKRRKISGYLSSKRDD